MKRKNPLKLKACMLMGFAAFALSSSPIMAADIASNTAQEQVAKALVNKGDSLASLHRYEESLAIFNDLITRFGNSHNPKIQGIVISALVNKGFDLRHLHRYEEALAVNNDLITRFGNSKNPIIQQAVAIARQRQQSQ